MRVIIRISKFWLRLDVLIDILNTIHTIRRKNVRTTNDSDFSIRPERVTAIICKELDKASIDICALSEVRHPGNGNPDK